MASSGSGRRKKPGAGSASEQAYTGPVQRKGKAPGKRTRTMDLPEPAAAVGQRKASASSADASDSSPASAGTGSELPADTREQMEASFGVDFSDVRAKESPRATELGAVAFTEGTDIHFAPGEYQPDTTSGKELLGHELTHVVQQSRGQVSATTQAKGTDINDDAALERQADEAGIRAARGERVDVAGGTSSGAIAPAHGVAPRKLKLTGKKAERNRAVQVMNASLFGYKASINKEGYVSLTETKKDGEANPQQKAMYNHLKSIIDDAKDTVVKMEGNNKEVLGGSYELGSVNMDDVELFGAEGGMTSQGVLIHELVEQYQKQVKGKEYGGEGAGAHGTAILAENEVGGSVRGPQKVVSYNDHGDGTFDAEVEVPYTFPNGREVTTTLKIEKGDLVSATHKETKPANEDKGKQAGK